MAAQARALPDLGPPVVLMKGGHLEGNDSPDVLLDGETLHRFEGQRHTSMNPHGRVCSLSSAVEGDLVMRIAKRCKVYLIFFIGFNLYLLKQSG